MLLRDGTTCRFVWHQILPPPVMKARNSAIFADFYHLSVHSPPNPLTRSQHGNFCSPSRVGCVLACVWERVEGRYGKNQRG